MAISAASLIARVSVEGTAQAAAELGLFDRTLRSVAVGGGAAAVGFLARDLVHGAAQGIAAVADLGITYQNNLNTMQAAAGASDAEMRRVAATAKALGADLTLPATSAADAAAAMTELTKAGLSVEQSQAAAKGVLQLAAAAGVEEAEAARIAANALNAFGLEASESGRVADILAAAANASSGEITDMALALQQASAVGSIAGQSIEDVGTAIALMANRGIIGSDAGTSLKTMLLALIRPTGDAATVMSALGFSAYDAHGNMLPLRDMVGLLGQSLEGYDQQSRNAALSTIFGSDAIRAAATAVMEGLPGWDAMKAQLMDTSAVEDVATAKTKGLGGAIEGLKSVLETVALSGFGKAAPAAESFVRWLAEGTPKAVAMASELAGRVAPTVDRVGDVIADVARFVGLVIDAGDGAVLALLGLGGGAVLGGLNLLLDIVSPLAGFLRDNELAAKALAVALGLVAASHISGGIMSVAGAVRSLTETLALKAMYARAAVGAAGGLRGGLGALGGIIGGLNPVTLALTGGVAALGAAFIVNRQEAAKAKDEMARWAQGLAQGVKDPADRLEIYRARLASVRAELRAMGSESDLKRAAVSGVDTAEAYKDLQEYRSLERQRKALQEEAGKNAQLVAAAEKSAAEERRRAVVDLVNVAVGGSREMAGARKLDVEGIKEQTKAIEDFKRGMTDSFAAATSLVQNFSAGAKVDLDSFARDVAAAGQRVADAQKTLRDAMRPASALDMKSATLDVREAQLSQADAADAIRKAEQDLATARQSSRPDLIAEAERKLVDAQLGSERSSISLARAQERVVELQKKGTEADQAVIQARTRLKEATDGVTEAHRRLAEEQAKVGAANQSVLGFFREQEATARQWSANLRELGKKGLDQGLLQDLALAGPKAAPLVAKVLDEVRRGNVGVINQSQSDMRKLMEDTRTALLAHVPAMSAAGQQVGGAIVGGISKGMQHLLPGLLGDTGNVLDNVTKSAKEKLGIKSPSQVFANEVGGPIAAGLAQGILRGVGAVADASSLLLGAAMPRGGFTGTAPTLAPGGPVVVRVPPSEGGGVGSMTKNFAPGSTFTIQSNDPASFFRQLQDLQDLDGRSGMM